MHSKFCSIDRKVVYIFYLRIWRTNKYLNEDNWNIVFTSYYETPAILSVCMDTQKLYKYLYKKLYKFYS